MVRFYSLVSKIWYTLLRMISVLNVMRLTSKTLQFDSSKIVSCRNSAIVHHTNSYLLTLMTQLLTSKDLWSLLHKYATKKANRFMFTDVDQVNREAKRYALPQVSLTFRNQLWHLLLKLYFQVIIDLSAQLLSNMRS